MTEAGRWLRDVRRFVPERIDEFFALLDHALKHPKPRPPLRRTGRGLESAGAPSAPSVRPPHLACDSGKR